MTRRAEGYERVTECLYRRQPPWPGNGRSSPNETDECMAGRRRATTTGDRSVARRSEAAHPAPGAARSAPDAARRPAAGSRGGPLLLAALVAGGVVAGVAGVTGVPDAAAEPTSVLAAQQELLTTDEDHELLPQASISVADAEARLEEVAASRAARAAADAAAAEAAREAARPKAVLPVAGARLTSTF